MIGSGRTDAGAHAAAQVAHMRTRSPISCERLQRSLNQLLPPDLAVLQVADAPPTFHARFDAVRKRYRYRIFTGAVVPPFIRLYVHQVRAPLNLSLMRREVTQLRGRHDFQAFARSGQPRRTTKRTITAITLRRRGAELHLDVAGDGFLHAMVRSIAGTLVDIGRGRLPPGTIRRMVQTRRRHLAGTTAPAQGLTLMAVDYRSRHA